MFKGIDRTKYDIKDPSAWTAMKRDTSLHNEALATVARYLNTPDAEAGGPTRRTDSSACSRARHASVDAPLHERGALLEGTSHGQKILVNHEERMGRIVRDFGLTLLVGLVIHALYVARKNPPGPPQRESASYVPMATPQAKSADVPPPGFTVFPWAP